MITVWWKRIKGGLPGCCGSGTPVFYRRRDRKRQHPVGAGDAPTGCCVLAGDCGGRGLGIGRGGGRELKFLAGFASSEAGNIPKIRIL